MLRIKGFDPGGKEISDSGVGFDWAGPEPNPFAAKFIPPGRISVEVPYRASADALSVEVSVTGVVYADRTFEGLPGEFFATRSQQAKTARQALDLLKSYPATRGETRETMKALLSLPNATHVGEAVANSLQLRAVPDSDHAPEQLSRKQWEDIKTELSQQATWYETESQPQVAKQPQPQGEQ